MSRTSQQPTGLLEQKNAHAGRVKLTLWHSRVIHDTVVISVRQLQIETLKDVDSNKA